jgi:hypothetical protein
MKKLVNVIGESDNCTSIRDIRLVFEVSYIYVVVTEQQQTNVIQKHETDMWLQLVKVKWYTGNNLIQQIYILRRSDVRPYKVLFRVNRFHKSG